MIIVGVRRPVCVPARASADLPADDGIDSALNGLRSIGSIRQRQELVPRVSRLACHEALLLARGGDDDECTSVPSAVCLRDCPPRVGASIERSRSRRRLELGAECEMSSMEEFNFGDKVVLGIQGCAHAGTHAMRGWKINDV